MVALSDELSAIDRLANAAELLDVEIAKLEAYLQSLKETREVIVAEYAERTAESWHK